MALVTYGVHFFGILYKRKCVQLVVFNGFIHNESVEVVALTGLLVSTYSKSYTLEVISLVTGPLEMQIVSGIMWFIFYIIFQAKI